MTIGHRKMMGAGFHSARFKPARAFVIAAALGLGSVLVSGCSGETEAPAEVEGVVNGLEVTNARLVLPPVSGNPAAIYFDIAYNGKGGVSIDGAEVEGASSAEVHDMMEYNFKMTMGPAGPIGLRSGDAKSFEPGGLHIMVFDLGEDVVAGGSTEVTLKIMGGDRHKFTADVRAAGEER